MAMYNTMSTYKYYEFEKRELIKLAEEFNKIRKKIENGKISYEEYNSYYEKFFEPVINNKLGFDYVTYGSTLLDADVEIKNEEEQKKFNKQTIVLGNFLAKYVIEQELHSSINPKEVYSNIK